MIDSERPSIDKERVKEELESVLEEKGALRAAGVLEFATDNEDSEIHAAFDRAGMWDDSIAAHKGRMAYASAFLRRFDYLVGQHTKKVVIRPAAYSMRAARELGRVRRKVVMTSNMFRDNLRDDARKDAETLMTRYGGVMTKQEIKQLKSLIKSLGRQISGGVSSDAAVAAAADA